MKVVTDIAQIDRREWKQLLETSSLANWFQSPAAYDFFVSVSDCLTPFIAAVYEKRLCGVMVGYIVPTDGFLRYFSERTIINGGPLLADDISDEALEALLRAVPNRGIYCETRNFNKYDFRRTVFEQCGWQYKPHYDLWISCDNSWRERIQPAKRQQIRRAQEDGQTWSEAQTEEDVKAWYVELRELYNTKVHRPLFPLSFFVAAWHSKACHLLIVRDSERNVIGGALVPHLPQMAYEWYICGPVMATYAILEWCEQNKIPRLDMMGAGEPHKHYGVRDFKLRMGGYLCKFGRFIKVNAPLRYRLGVAYINHKS